METHPKETRFRTITHKHANIYLVGGDDRCVLFDCGWQDSFPAVKAALKQYGVKFESIAGAFMSHFHPDHAGTLELLRRHGVKPLILERQMPFIEPLNEFFAQKKNDPRGGYLPFDAAAAAPITLAAAREILLNCGFDGEIMYTPEHSDDSISLVAGTAAFVGDLPRYGAEESRDALRRAGARTAYPAHGVTYEL